MEARVVDYAIVMAPGDGELVPKVRGAIRAGWEPSGGVVFAPGVTEDPETHEKTQAGFLVQAIVRRESTIALPGSLLSGRVGHG